MTSRQKWAKAKAYSGMREVDIACEYCPINKYEENHLNALKHATQIQTILDG